MKSSLFSRYTCFVLSILLTLVFLIMMHNHPWFWLPALACGCLMVLGIYDLTQQRHAICRNYPIIGRLRFFFEFIRPELRQYFLEQDNEEIPFSRTQRTLVYRRAKNEMGDKPFGELTGDQGVSNLAAWRNQHAPKLHVDHLRLVTIINVTGGVSALAARHQQSEQHQAFRWRFIQRWNTRKLYHLQLASIIS